MHDFFLGSSIFLCLLMALTMYRAVLGPTAIDRIMGMNLIGTKTTILLVIVGVFYDRVDMFVDIALAYALLNFIATIAAARYFQHGKDLSAQGFGYSHRRNRT